jgi:hypothetical protein
MAQLATRLPAMLTQAGYESLAQQVDLEMVGRKLAELEKIACAMAIADRDTVTHNRGTEIIEAGNIRFGLEMRTVGQDGGMAIHVLGDVAGQEVELLAFDCFRDNPHYHYGPRSRTSASFGTNARRYRSDGEQFLGQIARHVDSGWLSDLAAALTKS